MLHLTLRIGPASSSCRRQQHQSGTARAVLSTWIWAELWLRWCSTSRGFTVELRVFGSWQAIPACGGESALTSPWDNEMPTESRTALLFHLQGSDEVH